MNITGHQFRILLLSLSAKVPLLQTLKASFARHGGKLFVCGADSNSKCIGQFFVDKFWHMPELETLTPDDIIQFCRQHDISAIIPTRDGELGYFSRHLLQFQAADIAVLVTAPPALETCLDKLLFHRTIPELTVKTTELLDDLSADRFTVKERFGAGSKGLLLNANRDMALNHAENLEQPIFQPFIKGQEYSVDLYLDRSGKPLGIIPRSRDLIIDGEAQISTTVRNAELENICLTLAQRINLTGHLVIQAIIDLEQRVHILECNCRFGGASSLSIAAGLDSLAWFYCENNGIDPRSFPFERSPGELKQIRHATDMLITVEPSDGTASVYHN